MINNKVSKIRCSVLSKIAGILHNIGEKRESLGKTGAEYFYFICLETTVFLSICRNFTLNKVICQVYNVIN
jgi:hypothetical protein